MVSNGFRAACAILAWKTRKRFHAIYKLSLAKQSIEKWKAVAENWWKRTFHSSWYSKKGRLSTFLSTAEASFLEKYFGIVSADQLLISNHQSILQKLRHNHLDGIESSCALWEGMFYSWMIRAQEKCSNEVTHQNKPLLITIKEVLCGRSIRHKHSSAHGKKKLNGTVHDQNPLSDENDPFVRQKHTPSKHIARSNQSNDRPEFVDTYHSTFQTPMSCVDFLFIRSQNIVNDEQLSQINVPDITKEYLSFLKSHKYDTSSTDIREVVFKWKNDARKKLGMDFEVVKAAVPLPTRIDKSSGNAEVMCTISHLSRITTDNDGLPTRTIYTFDDANDALYRFRINIRKSRVPDSGNGAFMTYEGCSILKQSSHWKKKSLSGEISNVSSS